MLRASRARFVVLGFALLFVLYGCAGQSPSGSGSRPVSSPAAPSGGVVATQSQTGTGPSSLTGQPPATLPTPRRVAYGGDISVVVEDFVVAESELRERIARFDGYVANSNVDGSSGKARAGNWELRVPSEHFHELMDAVASLGTPEMRRTQAEDKTEEYVDLQARITNKREVERRVLKLIESRSSDLREIVSLEAELGRVREEVERLQGRLQMLAKITDLSTVRVTLREASKYVPPPAKAFPAQVQATWNRSYGTFIGFCKALTLCVVALAPWLPGLVVITLATIWIMRRSARRRMPVSMLP